MNVALASALASFVPDATRILQTTDVGDLPAHNSSGSHSCCWRLTSRQWFWQSLMLLVTYQQTMVLAVTHAVSDLPADNSSGSQSCYLPAGNSSGSHSCGWRLTSKQYFWQLPMLLATYQQAIGLAVPHTASDLPAGNSSGTQSCYLPTDNGSGSHACC